MRHRTLVASSALATLLAGASVAHLRAQTPAQLAAEQFEVDGQHSSVGFTVRLLRFVKVRGRFRDYDVAVTYDSLHPERSSVTAIIESKSIDTDMEFRDNHLRSPDFFDTQRFPTIEFHSDRVVVRADGLLISGPLTMHGVTRPIAFVAHVMPVGRVGASGNVEMEMEARLTLSRADFGIAGTNRFNPDYNPATSLLADSVDVNLELLAVQPGYLDPRLGRGTPPGIADTVLKTLDARGVRAAVAAYHALLAVDSAAYNFGPGQLDVLGHVLVSRGRATDALAMFQLNAERYPTRDAVLESLGTGEAVAGNQEAAVTAFRRAAELFPLSATAQEMLRRLTAADR